MVEETLNISGMMRNRHLARAVADAGMAYFLRMLTYKSSWYGAELVRVSWWFPSSRLCARCGWKNEELTLSDRWWRCCGCAAVNDRDLNADVNLQQAGF